LGNFIWANNIASGTSAADGYSIATDVAGNIYSTGLFDGIADFNPGIGIFNLTSAGQSDIFIFKMNLSPNGISENNFSNHVIISPNPSNEYSVINCQFEEGDELRLTDAFGKILFTKTFTTPTLNLKLQALNFPNGIYFLQLKTKDGVTSKKLVIQR